MPMLGYGVNTPNRLRLWSAEAPEEFDFAAFNAGNYYQAVDAEVLSETLTKVLYPNDEMEAGQTLRLEQQYFFVACSLRDMIRLQLQREKDLSAFHEKFVVQLNDTHPSIAVAELMRLLVDEYEMALGRRVVRHPADFRLHQSHAAARGSREMALAPVPENPAAALRNHLRDQRAFP
jgi:glucan phosphorylase